MRMVNDINDTLDVVEAISLNATPVWKPGHSTDEAPDFFMVCVHYAWGDDEMELGEYKMDGTMETYKKAIADFNRICLKAAKEGYFCLSDFQNCEIY